MNSFPENAKFKYPWRPYQARVLRDLDTHLDDEHLNIVAAPGSGKTVLGLEVMMRLNKPTLILAPTLAIRNQWVHRFTELFLQVENVPDWISTDIRKPSFLTVSTYQGLHSAMRDYKASHKTEDVDEAEAETDEELSSKAEGDPKDELVAFSEENNLSLGLEFTPDEGKLDASVVGLLKRQGVQTLVIDEAHHLRSEWWKSLLLLKEELDGLHVVGLTATPPYDSEPTEWSRYQSMSGPIDAEISVPELVMEKNLCPHQDYIYFNRLSISEALAASKFRGGVNTFLKTLLGNQDFTDSLSSHPHVLAPETHIETILSNPSYYACIAIYLNHAHREPPLELIKVLGLRRALIPKFDHERAEILLTNYLYKDSHIEENFPKVVEEVRKGLRKIGAVERRAVYLKNNKVVKKILKESVNKLDSIKDIVSRENKWLGEDLRLVVLADFIRKEGFNQKKFTRVGVIPIFEKLRREISDLDKLAVLTGSVIVMPRAAVDSLMKIAQDRGVLAEHISTKQFEADERFVYVNISGESNNLKVALLTQLFRQGEIRVMVGTASLLGEGWDAPSINTLILASYVGSFMLSNQMRGRAIRVDSESPQKTANIWHLVSIEGESEGYDYQTLRRRFRAFVGLSADRQEISNGIERLEVPREPVTILKTTQYHLKTMKVAEDRASLHRDWQRVLDSGNVKDVIQEIKTPKVSLPRRFVLFNTIKAVLLQGLVLGAYVALQIIDGSTQSGAVFEDLVVVLLVSAAFGLLVATPYMLKALYLFIRNGPVAGSMKQVGKAVLRSLVETGHIKTPIDEVRVVTEKVERAFVTCWLEGGTTYERTLFLNAIEEILSPIDNPRYLIARKTLFGGIKRTDFHAVPQVLGSHKKYALVFSKMWQKYVGRHDLIYTRRPEGRRVLVHARMKSLSSAFQKRSERRDKWR